MATMQERPTTVPRITRSVGEISPCSIEYLKKSTPASASAMPPRTAAPWTPIQRSQSIDAGGAGDGGGGGAKAPGGAVCAEGGASGAGRGPPGAGGGGAPAGPGGGGGGGRGGGRWGGE